MFDAERRLPLFSNMAALRCRPVEADRGK